MFANFPVSLHIKFRILFLVIPLVCCEIGQRQEYTFSTDEKYSVADFIIISNEEVLLVANSFHTNAILYVLDISGDNITTISTSNICTVSRFLLNLKKSC